jgi:glycosyltransferase involved in cell wall biosynthesis
MNDPRIVYIRNQKNKGQTASLNVGLYEAKAPLIARIDADDIWLPGKLSKQMAYMAAHPLVAVLGTCAYRIDNEGNRRGPADFPCTSRGVASRLFRGVPVCHVSVVMRRSSAMEVGGYPEHYRFAADYGLWSAIARAGGVIANLPERLTLFREDPQTFGAAQKVGAAGDESASIIQQNAQDIAGIILSFEECRDIALLFFPNAERTLSGIAHSYRNLKKLDAAIAEPASMRTNMELMAVLMWALARRWSHPGRQGRSLSAEWFWASKHFFLSPGALLAVNCAFMLASLGINRASRIKSSLVKLLADGRPKS